MLEQLEIRKSQLNSRIITGKSDETAQRQVIASITSQLKEVIEAITYQSRY